MHKVGGLPMISHVLNTAAALNAQETVTILSPDMAQVEQEIARVAPASAIAIQREQLGTGHAVRSALEKISFSDKIIYILYGDTPLVSSKILNVMRQILLDDARCKVTVLGMRPDDPAEYGRLVVAANGCLQRIVEFKDALPEERAITLCNSGVLCVNGDFLAEALPKLSNQNAKGEYYLTDIIGMAVNSGWNCRVVEGEAALLAGVNSREQLAEAEAVFQQQRRRDVMAQGVTLIAPETVFFSHDTRLAQDVMIHPHVVFGPGVTIGQGVEIKSFSHLEGAIVAENAIIGPYARLRPGANIAEQVHIGNFVEIKQADIGKGAKVNHLSYVGDAEVGEATNIGAGTITCNYDGYRKFRTVIGKNVFIGSDTALVAPIQVGDGAVVAAGSTLTEDVPEHALALARGEQRHIEQGASRYHAKRQSNK
jgi:bifunctional UDP-N-acetylglucosamine pyrophosphorylase/glucosamine-1-phosphate N-acetyltransferase